MLRLINTETKPSLEIAPFKHVINLLLSCNFSYSCMHAHLIVLLLSFSFVLKDNININNFNIHNEIKRYAHEEFHFEGRTPPQSGS